MESINELIPGEIDEPFSDIVPEHVDLLENITRSLKSDNDPIKLVDVGKLYEDGPIQLEILQPGITLNEPNSNELHLPNGLQFNVTNAPNHIENDAQQDIEIFEKNDCIEHLNNSETNKKMNIVYEIVQPEVTNYNYSINDEDFPTLTIKERKERKRMLAKTRSGRVSKPPKHLALDYKRIHLVDWNEEAEDSDGGYSDIHLSEKDIAIRNNVVSLFKKEESSTKKQYGCSLCKKQYIGVAGLARHYKLNPTHGSQKDLIQHYDKIVKDVNRSINDKLYNELPDDGEELKAKKRMRRLKHVIKDCSNEELMDIILPKLCPAVTPWEYLLMRSEFGFPPKPDPSQVYKDVKNLLERVSSFFQVNIEPSTEPANLHKNPGTFQIEDDSLASALDLTPGWYCLKSKAPSIDRLDENVSEPNDLNLTDQQDVIRRKNCSLDENECNFLSSNPLTLFDKDDN
ncbi:DgyrCDS745 [Dimorphilus gyrociliatus]|uniref:DgyrCDS745 n=1 Tax=Dimorphilus gyrociliatus TaxID=2664684 RepID=A0A7I8V6T6_9ANNE|nr:DgyrCDS745 [Dimorphilus gyrociliatus]